MAFYPLLPQLSLFYLRLIRRGSAYIFIFSQTVKMWTLLVGLYSTYAGSPTTRYDTKYALIYLVISVLPYEYYYSLRLSLIPILPRLFHYISIMPTTWSSWFPLLDCKVLHLYSHKFVTLMPFSYELLIVAYEIRPYLHPLTEGATISGYLALLHVLCGWSLGIYHIIIIH